MAVSDTRYPRQWVECVNYSFLQYLPHLERGLLNVENL